MKRSSLLAAAAALPFVLAFALPADEVAFAPAEGTSLTKSFTSSANFEMGDMSVLMNGQDPGQMPEMQMDMTVTQAVAVTDVYGPVSDGHPSKVTRTFDDIGTDIDVQVQIEMMGDTQDQSSEGSGTSPLEGETVIFTWNDDAEIWERAFGEDSDGDVELLEGLVEDMDLRALLPSGPVSEGDSWDIELKTLPDLFAPGGNLHMDVQIDGAESMGPDPEMMTNMREMFGDLLEGEATGHYAGRREVDGVEVGVIDVEISIETARDMSELVADMMGDNLPEGLDMTLDRMDVELSVESTGTLLWNLGAGHVHSFELDSDVEIAMDMAMNMDMGGQSIAMEMSLEMTGTFESALSTE